jgi:hypothetical protein
VSGASCSRIFPDIGAICLCSLRIQARLCAKAANMKYFEFNNFEFRINLCIFAAVF